jgi:hypothetical protein
MAPLFVNIVPFTFVYFLFTCFRPNSKTLELRKEFLEHRRDDSIPHGA